MNEKNNPEKIEEDVQAKLEKRIAEVEGRLKEGEKKSWFSSPILIALVGLIGTGIGASVQGFWNTALERQKFESSLIIKFLEVKDQKEAAKGLLFLVNAGLVPNLDAEKIKKLAENPQNIPLRSGTAKDPFGEQLTWEQTSESQNWVKLNEEWEKKNIVDVTIPQLLSIPGLHNEGKIRFHKKAAEPLKASFAEIEEKGLLNLILSWDGGYHPALIRGSEDKLGSHTFGTAFDINALYNPFGRTPPPAGTKGSVRELVPIFEKHGFEWGGNYSRPDGMHFQYKLRAGN